MPFGLERKLAYHMGPPNPLNRSQALLHAENSWSHSQALAPLLGSRHHKGLMLPAVLARHWGAEREMDIL